MPPQDPKELFIRSLTESQSRLYGHIYSLRGNHHAAAEVLQETNLVLWRKLDEFRAGSDFIPWAFGVARFQVLAHLGDTKRPRARFVDADLRKLHSLDQTHRVLGGKGLSWATSGERADFPVNPQSFPSFDDVRDRTKERSQRRYEVWQKWNQSLAEDPRIEVRYDFEPDAPALTDSGPTQSHGLIIGCERTNGRWAEKGALGFNRPSDRVRVDIPGSYDALTLTAWIRIDASPGRQQGLLLTDGYTEGHPHWQIAPEGSLRLGLRIPSSSKRTLGTGYGSPVLFTPGQMGVWSLVATVYHRQESRVRHYFNGREVSAESIHFDQALEIGPADIGNWGVPFGRDKHPVRNFVGRMDELTLWKVALKGDELQTMYRQTRP